MDLGMVFLLTGVFLILVGFLMGDEDNVLRDIALVICAACLLMIVGACLAMLTLHFVPAFFMLFTQVHGVPEFI
jgi:hypothetical protein